MSLAPGTQIECYEIISLLGRGGMGEVYLANDNRLPRQVAVKVLKKLDSGDQLRRFRQEARMASTLNHPNILSVYEFGEHGKFPYIVMEFVDGKSLRAVISEGTLKTSEAVGIAVQIGNSLAAAHEAGIIHRDIKPENVMVLPDGHVKVLDFGLAKLIETGSFFRADPQESTVSIINTTPGLITGTVSYMAPEQLRGQGVDARADIWSLGVVLYEMFTGQRPFSGESVSDTIAAVLMRPFPSSANVPAGLENILAKALSKDRDERYENIKDLVKDLQELQGLLSSGATVFTNALKITEKKRDRPPGPVKKPRILRWTMLIALLFFVSGVSGWFYLNRPPETPASSSSPAPRGQTAISSRPISTSGTILNAVLSPDGSIYAYAQEGNGKQSLHVRPVTGGRDVLLIPPDNVEYGGIRFSPDGDTIFYSVFGEVAVSGLHSIPVKPGGPARIISADVDSPITFSPDGSQFAFLRTKSHEGVDQILVSNADGSGEYVLSERTYPKRYVMSSDLHEGLDWSPDGRTIACAASVPEEGGGMTVVGIDVQSREERDLTLLRWFRVGKVLWTNDSRDLIITAADAGNPFYRILRISGSDGQSSLPTSVVFSDYLDISFSSDSRSLLAMSDDRSSAIYVGDSADPNSAKQVAEGNMQGVGGLAWTPDGKIVYVSMEKGNRRNLWRMDADGENSAGLTSGEFSNEYPSVSSDGKIAFLSYQKGEPHVWVMSSDGSEGRQLTFKDSENFPRIAPDGKSVFYTAKPLSIWRAFLNGEPNSAIPKTPVNWIAVSPDGLKVAGISLGQKGFHLSIFTLEGREISKFDLEGNIGTPRFPPLIRWRPDGNAIGYIATLNGVSNIMVQRLSGGKPKLLTNFSVDKIFAFEWSKDGKKIAIARGKADNHLTLFENL